MVIICITCRRRTAVSIHDHCVHTFYLVALEEEDQALVYLTVIHPRRQNSW